jgi:hypothetical protein
MPEPTGVLRHPTTARVFLPQSLGTPVEMDRGESRVEAYVQGLVDSHGEGLRAYVDNLSRERSALNKPRGNSRVAPIGRDVFLRRYGSVLEEQRNDRRLIIPLTEPQAELLDSIGRSLQVDLFLPATLTRRPSLLICLAFDRVNEPNNSR